MKPIQTYTPEAIEKLRQWIEDMNAKGDCKYYEIFIDGLRVVQKTNDIKMFDCFENWMAADTQQVKVLTYNTQASHRSTVFEFRTVNFAPEVNYKELAEASQKKIDELTKRLSDAELYINKLEARAEQPEKNAGFDLQSILTMFGTLAKSNPEMAQNLGLGNLLNAQTEKPKKEAEQYAQATFKRKETADAANNAAAESNKTQEDKLKPEDSQKLSELNVFFQDNSAYIAVIHELIEVEKLKNAA